MRFAGVRSVLVSTIGISTSLRLSRYQSRCSSDIALQSSVSDLRKEYSDKALLESDVDKNPYLLFQSWFDEACKANILEPNAMCLSTCKDNKPSVCWLMISVTIPS
jgi:pyridoxine/pyridoxamine 5'-phosphate oxidase